jgi:hypothetical protein
MEAPEDMPSGEAEKYGYTTYRNKFDIYRVALDGSGTVEKLPNYQAPEVRKGWQLLRERYRHRGGRFLMGDRDALHLGKYLRELSGG